MREGGRKRCEKSFRTGDAVLAEYSAARPKERREEGGREIKMDGGAVNKVKPRRALQKRKGDSKYVI